MRVYSKHEFIMTFHYTCNTNKRINETKYAVLAVYPRANSVPQHNASSIQFAFCIPSEFRFTHFTALKAQLCDLLDKDNCDNCLRLLHLLHILTLTAATTTTTMRTIDEELCIYYFE